MQITLVSSDEIKYLLENSESVKMSGLINSIIEDRDDLEVEIPLPTVKSDILKLVIEFCSEFSKNPFPEIEKPLKSNDMEGIVPGWCFKFLLKLGEFRV